MNVMTLSFAVYSMSTLWFYLCYASMIFNGFFVVVVVAELFYALDSFALYPRTYNVHAHYKYITHIETLHMHKSVNPPLISFFEFKSKFETAPNVSIYFIYNYTHFSCTHL